MVLAWQTATEVAKPPPAPLRWTDPSVLWSGVALAAVLLAGAVVIALLDRWRKRSEPPTLTANDQLAAFRELYERGELSQEEFERLRVKLSGKLRKELDIPGRPSEAPPKEQPQPPANAEPGKSELS
jgi:hypothetical protein